jgi:hypothetical protein
MISSMLHRKQGGEDQTTSLVFDFILLLPDPLPWQILRDSVYGELPVSEPGTLRYDDRDFWPHWDPTGIDSHTNYIEPDVFICFDNLDVIGEAKLPGNIQNDKQWRAQIIAYYNEHCDEEKSVILLAIDGLGGKTESEQVTVKFRNDEKEVTVFKTDWQRICEVLEKQRKVKRFDEPVNLMVKRIVDMAITWLNCFGFFKMAWLDELGETGLSIDDNYAKDIKLLETFGAYNE